MKQYIRCYQMFLPGNYLWLKLCLYLLYPLAAIRLALIGIHAGAFNCLITAPMIITAFEIMLDYFFFGGIASKDTNRLEYLKTSYRGTACLKKGLTVDSIRRFLSAAVIELGVYFAIGAQIRQEDGIGIWQVLFFVFVIFFIEELAFEITRRFTYIWINALVYCMIDLAWLVFLMGFRWFAYVEGIIMTLIFAVLCIGMVVFRIKLTINKMRRSYYDE